jgi:hypothetical protein
VERLPKFFLLFVLVSFFTLVTQPLRAQLPPPPPDPTTEETPPCWPPPCIPIDGGLTFLVIAGAGYAGKKLYDKRKNNLSND